MHKIPLQFQMKNLEKIGLLSSDGIFEYKIILNEYSCKSNWNLLQCFEEKKKNTYHFH